MSTRAIAEREFLARYADRAVWLLVPGCLAAGFAVAFVRWEYIAAFFGGLIALVGVLANPFLGLIGYVVLEYARPGEVIPALTVLRPQRLLALLLLVSLFLRYRDASRPRLSWSPVHLGVLALLASAWLAIPGAYWRGGAASMAIDFTKAVLLYFAIAALLSSESRIRQFVVVLLGCTVLVALTMLSQAALGRETYITEGVERVGSLGSFLANPNDAAVALLAGLPLALYLWPGTGQTTMDRGPWTVECGSPLVVALRSLVVGRPSLVVAIALILAALILSGSRGGFLGVLTVAVICWWRSRRKLLSFAVLMLTALMVWGLAPTEYRGRMATILDSGSDVSAQGRLEGWRVATAIFWRQPVTGVGGGNFVVARADWFPTGDARTDWTDVHSLYFQALSELGLFGAVSLVAFLVLALREGSCCRRAWSIQAAFLGLLVAGAFTHLLFYPFLYTLAALMTAVRRVEGQAAEEGR
jgi:O-antigen ligase